MKIFLQPVIQCAYLQGSPLHLQHDFVRVRTLISPTWPPCLLHGRRTCQPRPEAFLGPRGKSVYPRRYLGFSRRVKAGQIIIFGVESWGLQDPHQEPNSYKFLARYLTGGSSKAVWQKARLASTIAAIFLGQRGFKNESENKDVGADGPQGQTKASYQGRTQIR